MNIEDTMDWKLKCAILDKFEKRTETYWLRFCTTLAEEEEIRKQVQTHLTDLYDKWMVPKEKTKEQMGDANYDGAVPESSQ